MNENRTNRTTNVGGTGFVGLLTIAFIVLKLTGVIAWSWLWVLSPIWISLIIGLGIVLIVMIVALIGALASSSRRK